MVQYPGHHIQDITHHSHPMATAAPHSTRRKTMVVRSTVVHLADEITMLEVWKAGIDFFAWIKILNLLG